MFARASSVLCGLILSSLLLFSARVAHAWVETNVRSHQARIELKPDGTAVVRHELVIKLRGGPTKAIEVGGVGTAIEPLPDALVRRAAQGSSSKWPLAVSSLEDGSVRLKILSERGIRGGSYLFSFAYSVDLNQSGGILPQAEGAEVSWIGPRLVSGVDSAKVVFSIPRSHSPPQLVVKEGPSAGILLGEVRRGAEFDEIELIRAHLATGEPAVWTILVAPEALSDAPALSVTQMERSPLISAERTKRGTNLARARMQRNQILISILLAFVYGLLVFFKARSVQLAAHLVDARAKGLLPGPPWVRALLALGLVGTGTWFGLERDPWSAVALGALAACCATHLVPVRVVRPRGPGRWERVDLSSPMTKRRLPGRGFETTTVQGFGFFLLLLTPIVVAAFRLLPTSNFFALMTTVLALLLAPLFWTGRHSDLPQSPRQQAEPWLRYLSRAIDPNWAGVELWGRCSSVVDPMNAEQNQPIIYDEVRIRLVLSPAPAGLRALEVSLDEAAGACVLPCVVLRVTEESPSLEKLPADIPWQRGRKPEERVALLRPSAPTRAQLLRLVRALIGNLRSANRSQIPASKRAA